jgi:uncharacterized protein involved in exopolysaccharide biosynthesis
VIQKEAPKGIDPPQDEVDLSQYVLVLLRRKKMILWVLCLALILSVTYSFLSPNRYTATTRILPPQEPNTGISGMLLQTNEALGGLAGGLMGVKTSSELSVGILESRTVAEILVKEYDLKKLYGQKSLDRVLGILADRTRVEVSRKTQIISVSVTDTDPKRAADMANAYADALDKINRAVNVTAGQRKRAFLEDRLKRVREDLLKAEMDLKAFQEKHRLVAINEQAKTTIDGAARLKGELIAAQTELEVLKSFGTERQNEAVKLKSKISELRKQLGKIESGSAADGGFYIPFSEFPSLGLELARLLRETKIQEEVFKLVTTQYELAKIEEAKDVNTVQVLDRAVAPDQRSGPRRSLIISLSLLLAFFGAVFYAFTAEYVARLRQDSRF